MNDQTKLLIMNVSIVVGLMTVYEGGAPLPPVLFSGVVAFGLVNGIIWWKRKRR